jgi:hypothetical protein
MQYSPKLKKVMYQIQQMLKENDIAGVIVLHTIEQNLSSDKEVKGFSEYSVNISPSYSAASLQPAFVVKGKAEHYNGDKEVRNKIMAQTSNMLVHLAEISGRCTMLVMDCQKTYEKYYGKDDHTGGELSSNQSQNN